MKCTFANKKHGIFGWRHPCYQKKSGFKSGTVEEGSGAYRREWHERHTLVVNRVAYRKGEAERKELFHERNGSKLLAADPWW